VYLLLAVSFYFPAQAQPPLWDPDFGTELAVVSDCDDCEEAIALPFPFPFNGSSFDMAYVGANGCMQLGRRGLDNDIDFDLFIYMEEFLSDSDPDNPLICPFNSEFDPGSNVLSKIYYNDSQNPVIITWDRVTAVGNSDALTTFQILLYENGLIVFNYNGILNGPGDNIIDDLNSGIVVGVTPSDLPFDSSNDIIPSDPGPVDLNQGPFDFGPTAYERWCFDEANSCGVDGTDTGLSGPVNTAFDLDFWSICFTPNEDGFSINSGFEGQVGNCNEFVFPIIPTLSEWGLIAMAAILGIVGFMVMRRRKVTA
jgi:hypothetical protein